MARKKKQQKENRVLVVGHGRHGKDVTSSVLQNLYGLEFRGSSEVMCNEPEILERFNQYETGEELFNARHSHREELYEAICEYNKEDRTRLARQVSQGGKYGYTGMRDFDEVMACIKEGLFTHIIWVERRGAPLDPSQTFTFEDIYEEFLLEETSFSLARVKNYPLPEAVTKDLTQEQIEARVAQKLSVLFVKKNMGKFLELSNTFTMFA